jgi:hypothetical protein
VHSQLHDIYSVVQVFHLAGVEIRCFSNRFVKMAKYFHLLVALMVVTAIQGSQLESNQVNFSFFFYYFTLFGIIEKVQGSLTCSYKGGNEETSM